MKKLLLLLVIVFSYAMTSKSQTVIELTEAGTLKEKLPNYDGVTSLAISGPINGTDLRYVRELCGMNVSGGPSKGKVSNLDLSGANIVSGGQYYMYDYSTYEEFFTKNDELGTYAFFNCPAIEVITLPKTLKKVGQSAFTSCANLREILVGEGNESFYSIDGCLYSKADSRLVKYPQASTIKYFSVAAGTKIIGYDAISNAYNIELITLPEGLTTIEGTAFCFSNKLDHIDIPSSVTSIGVSAFNYCNGLQAINVAGDNSVYASVDGVLFTKDMQTLYRFPVKRGGSYSVPASVTRLEEYSFSTCANISNIILPENLEKIGPWTFDGCYKLASLDIPSTVNSVGYAAFNDCRLIKSLHIPDAVIYLDDWLFAGCKALNDLKISANVKKIGVGMLQNCSSLTSFVVPEAVTIVPKQIFYGCTALKEVTIPSGVKEVSAYSFMGCTSLAKLTVYSEIPPACYMMPFVQVPQQTCLLRVPYGRKSAYQAANEWKNFLNIEEMEQLAVESISSDDADNKVIGYYTLDGKQIDKPQHGITLVKMSNGSTRKIIK